MLIFQKIKSNHDSMIFKKIIGKSNQRVHRQNHRSLPVGGSCGHLWLKLYAWTQNNLFHQRRSIRFFTIFGGKTNTHMQQNLKITIVLGVSMLVQGSYAWILSSYVVEILRLDKDKTGYVNKVLMIHNLLFLKDTKYPLTAESKSTKSIQQKAYSRKLTAESLQQSLKVLKLDDAKT